MDKTVVHVHDSLWRKVKAKFEIGSSTPMWVGFLPPMQITTVQYDALVTAIHDTVMAATRNARWNIRLALRGKQRPGCAGLRIRLENSSPCDCAHRLTPGRSGCAMIVCGSRSLPQHVAICCILFGWRSKGWFTFLHNAD